MKSVQEQKVHKQHIFLSNSCITCSLCHSLVHVDVSVYTQRKQMLQLETREQQLLKKILGEEDKGDGM